MFGDMLASLLGSPDTSVQLYSHSLRIVRSHTPESGEPWYILTSDLTNSADHVLKVYRHRFEIEETFRDIKHVFGMVSRVLKPLSLKVVLWLVSLGSPSTPGCSKEIIVLELRRRGNPKKRCSWLKRAYGNGSRPRWRCCGGGHRYELEASDVLLGCC